MIVLMGLSGKDFLSVRKTRRVVLQSKKDSYFYAARKRGIEELFSDGGRFNEHIIRNLLLKS